MFLAFALLCVSGVFAQEKEGKEEKENIGTETVNVVKPYKATVSDAFKIREVPAAEDSVLLQKKEINYSIFSVPVASTFVPAKGKVAGIGKKKREYLYDTYLSLGLGNYSTALLDFYTSAEISKDQSFDIGLNHHSAQGQLDETELDTKFFDTKLEAAYKNAGRFYRWGVNGGLQHQIYNWYGLPAQAGFDEAVINSIDEKQTYYTASLGGNIEAVEESVFTGAELSLKRFWDAHDSGENRVVLNPSFRFPVGEELITAHVFADYVGGEFKYEYYTGEKSKYSNLLLGVNPNLVIAGEDYTINLGASVFYGMDIENDDNDFYIYPKVNASYRLVEEYVTIYGGVEGGLDQNSYYDFVQDNVYVAPALMGVTPTDRQYDAYVGMKGKLSSNVGYNLKGSYRAENNKPLFRANPVNISGNENHGYVYGNSFGVVYDDVTTFSAFGEIHADIDRNLTLGINAEVFGYNTDNQEEAWNLPIVKGSFFGDYQIDEHWFAGANIFYVGQRKDMYVPEFAGEEQQGEVVKLDSYFDANAHLGYHIDQQWSVFVKANNIANNQYARWMNYPVQGFQILGGITYKFDLWK
ncbi:TonB-dependent receptor [Sinomicrobium sp. FJxs]|uniref:TonB-dependent receptor n=1 Tax=Sinomicrobium weinanense TaxID=2842200 RepID=A0A926Q554_9FLAO|nr:TonB-dependent receptor [Sinomicrobium weinanense]MBU3124870.1 TonB-dependent receptor [Sinomicrobium weinanense]